MLISVSVLVVNEAIRVVTCSHMLGYIASRESMLMRSTNNVHCTYCALLKRAGVPR